MEAEPLLSLAASVAGEQETRKVLDGIVRGLARQPGVALARIWFYGPGDICTVCKSRPDCHDQTRCLHLVASAGASVDGGEDWSYLQGRFSRIPLGTPKVALIAETGKSLLLADEAQQKAFFLRPEWAQREGIRAFAGHPLIFRGTTLGVLALFSRLEMGQQDFAWLRMFADQAAVAISNARAFESLERAEADLAKHANLLRQVAQLHR